jgi:hypothetical protein
VQSGSAPVPATKVATPANRGGNADVAPSCSSTRTLLLLLFFPFLGLFRFNLSNELVDPPVRKNSVAKATDPCFSSHRNSCTWSLTVTVMMIGSKPGCKVSMASPTRMSVLGSCTRWNSPPCVVVVGWGCCEGRMVSAGREVKERE